jgi:hypothetical protein
MIKPSYVYHKNGARLESVHIRGDSEQVVGYSVCGQRACLTSEGALASPDLVKYSFE